MQPGIWNLIFGFDILEFGICYLEFVISSHVPVPAVYAYSVHLPCPA